MSLAIVSREGIPVLDIERVRDAIERCRHVDEVKDIIDKSIAVSVYLRKKNAALSIQNSAVEIVLRAERRLGELLSATELHRGGRPTKTVRKKSQVSTLADLGVERRQSARAQRLASIPADSFEKRIAVVQRDAERLTIASMLGSGSRESSPSLQSRRTPRWLFDQLNQRFGPFELDAFAEPHNALCKRFYTREQDGCRQPWMDVTFGNPEFEDMGPPLEQALRQAEAGIRSCIIGPVGCSQAWYHKLAIRGTVYVPNRRISFDLPDGTSTDPRRSSQSGADRDTIVMCFGGEYANQQWKRGMFRVCRLELSQ